MKTILKNIFAIPGLANLTAIPIKDIVAISVVDSEEKPEHRDVLLNENPDVYLFQQALDSTTSMIRTMKSNAGTYYNGRFTCFVSGLSPENHDVFEKMKEHTFVVIYQDYNGQLRCFGDPEIGLIIEVIERSSPRAGYEIIFSGDGIIKPLNVKTVQQIEWDTEHPQIFNLTLQQDPNKPYLTVYSMIPPGGDINTFSIHAKTVPMLVPPGLSITFSGWDVVSGNIPTGLFVDYNPLSPEQFIEISSSCVLQANWIIEK